MGLSACAAVVGCSGLEQAATPADGDGTPDTDTNATTAAVPSEDGDDGNPPPDGDGTSQGEVTGTPPGDGVSTDGVSTDDGGSTDDGVSTSDGAESSDGGRPSSDDAGMETGCEARLGTTDNCAACGDTCVATDVCTENACTSARRVFLSSAQYDGDFGGVEGADAACQTLAEAEAMGGHWRAFIADPNTGLARHSMLGGPYLRMDAASIADDWDDLTDGEIDVPLNIDETGQMVGGNVWTGLSNGGNSTCADWTYNGNGCLEGSPCGVGGESNLTDDHWDGFFVYHCDSTFRLYCVEQ